MGNACQKQSGKSFEKQCLAAHNRYRAMHGVPALKLDKKLCSYAGEWAEKLADTNSINHRDSPPYGENIYMASGFEVKGEDPVKSWYEEADKYEYGNPHFQPGTGHFTQIVWKDSQRLGVGVARRDNTTWVVANYDPPGNVQNCFPVNVLPKK